MSSSLYLSSDKAFYTIEGEGKYVGQPSVFLRLGGCNLTCKGWATPDSPHGCDSYVAWSNKTKYTIDETVDLLVPWKSKLKNNAILKITGGEPMIQKKPLKELFVKLAKWGILYIDFETNGTVEPFSTVQHVVTWTVSPKLSTNGDPESKTYKPEVLKEYVELSDEGLAIFKFGVTCSDDIDEIMRKYVDKLGMNPYKIWLMPVCGSRQEHSDRAPQVAEWCKEYGFNFSPRLQLVIWDKALGV